METERQNICLAKNVGTYLKHKLRSTQMTQAQFAERMGVEERTVRRWVSGDIHKIEIIEDIACMFQDDITSVVTFEEDDDVFLFAWSTSAADCRTLYDLLLLSYSM